MQTSKLLFLVSVLMTLSILGCSPSIPPTATQATATAISPTNMVPTSEAPLELVEGVFRNQIRHLEESMPRSGSEAYMVPSNEEQANFSKLVSLVYDNDLTGAIQLAGQHHYRLNYYVDKSDDSAASYLLREQKPIQKGWGLYAFRVDATSNIIVEAPHPLYDKRTPTVAMDVYQALDARALLIAGAHRHANQDGSADVAHAPESIFLSIHEAMLKEIEPGQAIILQIHGFHSGKHAGYPQAVLGFGEVAHPAETALAKAIESAFSTQGIHAGLCIDDSLRELCGKTNREGARSDGAIFIHMELEESIRKHDEALIAALLQVFGPRVSN